MCQSLAFRSSRKGERFFNSLIRCCRFDLAFHAIGQRRLQHFPDLRPVLDLLRGRPMKPLGVDFGSFQKFVTDAYGFAHRIILWQFATEVKMFFFRNGQPSLTVTLIMVSPC